MKTNSNKPYNKIENDFTVGFRKEYEKYQTGLQPENGVKKGPGGYCISIKIGKIERIQNKGKYKNTVDRAVYFAVNCANNRQSSHYNKKNITD